MKVEKAVLVVGGTSMLIGGVTGLAGLITSEPLLKSFAIYALGFGVIIGCTPLLFLLGAMVLGKKGG